jgi:hypothetical protein
MCILQLFGAIEENFWGNDNYINIAENILHENSKLTRRQARSAIKNRKEIEVEKYKAELIISKFKKYNIYAAIKDSNKNSNILEKIEDKQNKSISENTTNVNLTTYKNKDDNIKKLESMISSHDYSTRIEAARNENITKEMLLKLSEDDRCEVRYQAKKRLDELNKKTNTSSTEDILQWETEAKISAALSLYTAPDVLEKLSKDTTAGMRDCLAKNINTPPHILRKLSDTVDLHTLTCLAKNSNIPQDIILQLSKHTDCSIRLYIAKNSNTHYDILKMLSDDKDTDVSRAARSAINIAMIDYENNRTPINNILAS